MKFRKTATAIIVHNNKILLFKRDNIPTIKEPDRWQLPGGHLEDGESPLEALKRELVEEVSYSPKKIHYVGSLKNKIRETNVYWSYVDTNETKKFKLGEEEGQEIKFMTIEQALKEKLTKNVRFYLESYKDVLRKHLKKRTVPSIEDLKKNTSLLKFVYSRITD